jgi:flagellin
MIMSELNASSHALTAIHALHKAERQQSRAMEQLSTGQRIMSAADDVAGFAINNKMAFQISGLHQAVRNANDGISMLQVADSAVSGIQSMLFRMRDLAVQSLNDTYSSDDRTALDTEFQELESEISKVLETTHWNGANLLDGSAGNGGTVALHVGDSPDDGIALNFADLTSSELATTRSIALPANSSQALISIDLAMNDLDSNRAVWGAAINRLSHTANHGMEVAMQMSVSKSRIADADYAQATADMARAMILKQAGTAMLSQANQMPRQVLALLR